MHLRHDNLRVRIGSTDINSKTMDTVAASVAQDGSLLRLIEVSRSPTVESAELEGIGRVNLRIIVDKDGELGQRTLALVRGCGHDDYRPTGKHALH